MLKKTNTQKKQQKTNKQTNKQTKNVGEWGCGIWNALLIDKDQATIIHIEVYRRNEICIIILFL